MQRVRYIILGLAALVMLPQAADARKFELTPYGGYRWGGDLRDTNSSADGALFDLGFENGAVMGVAFDLVTTVPYLLFEIFWDRQFTELAAKDNQTGESTSLGNVDIDNVHLGIVYELSQVYNYSSAPPVRPFLGFTFGGARFAPANEDLDKQWRFTIGFMLGINYFFAERVGLRVQTRIMTTYFNSSSETFCDEAGRCFVLADAAFMNQVDLTGGLLLSF